MERSCEHQMSPGRNHKSSCGRSAGSVSFFIRTCSPRLYFRWVRFVDFLPKLLSSHTGSFVFLPPGNLETEFATIPEHLALIVTEILKNALRATVEFYTLGNSILDTENKGKYITPAATAIQSVVIVKCRLFSVKSLCSWNNFY